MIAKCNPYIYYKCNEDSVQAVQNENIEQSGEGSSSTFNVALLGSPKTGLETMDLSHVTDSLSSVDLSKTPNSTSRDSPSEESFTTSSLRHAQYLVQEAVNNLNAKPVAPVPSDPHLLIPRPLMERFFGLAEERGQRYSPSWIHQLNRIIALYNPKCGDNLFRIPNSLGLDTLHYPSISDDILKAKVDAAVHEHDCESLRGGLKFFQEQEEQEDIKRKGMASAEKGKLECEIDREVDRIVEEWEVLIGGHGDGVDFDEQEGYQDENEEKEGIKEEKTEDEEEEN